MISARNANNTRQVKARRETALKTFLERIREDGTWRQWLNPASNELHIAKICAELGKTEGSEKACWDSTCFRGANWAALYKDEFNMWVRAKLYEEAHSITYFDLDTSDPLSNILPQWLLDLQLPTEVINYCRNLAKDHQLLHGKVSILEKQLQGKDRKVIELQIQLNSLAKAYQAKDDHYMLSIRSLAYDD